MSDLYIQDRTEDQQSLSKKIQNYIEIAYKISSKKTNLNNLSAQYKVGNRGDTKKKLQDYLDIKDKGLQKKIDQHTNLRAYTFHRNEPEKSFVMKVNNLFSRFGNYLDSSEKAFISSFADNYQKSIFELVMAEFLAQKQKHSLITRSNNKKSNSDGEADLAFINQSNDYFLECTTRNSSLMDIYVEQLIDFDRYLKIAKIFHRRNKELHDSGEHGWNACWITMAEQVWYRLELNQQQSIINTIKTTSTFKLEDTFSSHPLHPPRWLFIKLEEWVDLNQYAWFYFRDLLPSILTKKIKPILPLAKSDDMGKVIPFLIKSIVMMMIRKLDKPYFEKNIPVILALSLSTLPDFMSPTGAFNQFELIAKSIAKELQENISNYVKNEESLKKIRENLKSLYAVIIDTTWYNWFPEIVEEKHQAKWSGGCKNCYIIIYNTRISKSIPHDHKIFTCTIMNEIDLPLTIDHNEAAAIDSVV